MNLKCQHCGEQIVARSFGKCPGCYQDLPDELQLSAVEREMKEIDERETDLGKSLGDGSWTIGGIDVPL